LAKIIFNEGQNQLKRQLSVSLQLKEYFDSVMSPVARAFCTFSGLEVLQARLLGFRWYLYQEDSQVLLTSYMFHWECSSMNGSSDGKGSLRSSLLFARLSVFLMQIFIRLRIRGKPLFSSTLPRISAIDPDCFIFHDEFKAALGCMHTIHINFHTVSL